MIRVFGDIILDVWIKGKCERNSSEAPVKILDVDTVTHNLGGASNVAANIKNLRNSVKLYGSIGNDNNGFILNNLLKKNRIKSKIKFTRNITTIKTRLIDGQNKHLLRVDSEKKN